MSFSIYYSSSVRVSSTTQDLLNDLAQKWDGWKTIEYNTPGDSTSGVAKLWVSDLIHLSGDTASTPRLQITHTTANQSATATGVVTSFAVVTSESGVLMRGLGSNTTTFAVGKTTDPDGVESYGVISAMGNIANHTIFTDNMTADSSTIAAQSSAKTGSNYFTQLVPVCSITGNEIFTGVYMILLGKSTDNGQILMDDRKYYFVNEANRGIAIEYT